MGAFPRVQSLRGELKRTEIRSATRYQLTTRELVVQRRQGTYRIAFENILGFLECSDEEFRMHKSIWSTDKEQVGRPYKIVATVLYLITQQGVLEQTKVSFYTRLSAPFARQMEALLKNSAGSIQGA